MGKGQISHVNTCAPSQQNICRKANTKGGQNDEKKYYINGVIMLDQYNDIMQHEACALSGG